MIRPFKKDDLNSIIKIWFNSNVEAHSFIPKEYWENNYEAVKNLLPQAEIYVYEDDSNQKILGFIGLTGNYIEGIFISEEFRSKGIGKQLLNYVKKIRSVIKLKVYQKNTRAVRFYKREQFVTESESFDVAVNEKEFIMAWNKQQSPDLSK